jgi:hypothetical protein
MIQDHDVERDVRQFNAAGADPLVARIILCSVLGRYGRERVRQELIRQATSAGVVSIATALNWAPAGTTTTLKSKHLIFPIHGQNLR